jgi:threonine dehydrogenase-like Zn-dependent dehydrogenase
MFVDVVVIAGIGTVGLMVAFLAGFSYFIWKDSHKIKAAAKIK